MTENDRKWQKMIEMTENDRNDKKWQKMTKLSKNDKK